MAAGGTSSIQLALRGILGGLGDRRLFQMELQQKLEEEMRRREGAKELRETESGLLEDRQIGAERRAEGRATEARARDRAQEIEDVLSQMQASTPRRDPRRRRG